MSDSSETAEDGASKIEYDSNGVSLDGKTFVKYLGAAGAAEFSVPAGVLRLFLAEVGRSARRRNAYWVQRVSRMFRAGVGRSFERARKYRRVGVWRLLFAEVGIPSERRPKDREGRVLQLRRVGIGRASVRTQNNRRAGVRTLRFSKADIHSRKRRKNRKRRLRGLPSAHASRLRRNLRGRIRAQKAPLFRAA